MRNIYKQFQLLSLFLFFLGTFLICCQGISSAKTSDDEFVVRKLGSIEKLVPLKDPLSEYYADHYQRNLDLIKEHLAPELYVLLQKYNDPEGDKEWSLLAEKLQELNDASWSKEEKTARAGLLCTVLLGSNRPKETFQFCDLAAELAPSDSINLVKDMQAAFAVGKYEKVSELVQTAGIVVETTLNNNLLARLDYYATAGSFIKTGLVSIEGNFNVRALSYFQRALDFADAITDLDPGTKSMLLAQIADCYGRLGQMQKARSYYSRAAVLLNSMPYTYFATRVEEIYPMIASFLAMQGEVSKSKAFLDEALYMNSKRTRVDVVKNAHLYAMAASTYLGLGDYKEVITWSQKSLDISKQYMGEANRLTISNYLTIGDANMVHGDFSSAKKYYKKGYDLNLKYYGADDITTLLAAKNLAYTLRMTKEYEKAMALYGENIPRSERFWGAESPLIAEQYAGYSDCFYALNKFNEACIYMEKAYLIYKKIEGEHGAKTGLVRDLLVGCLKQREADAR